ncbi:MAG: hypothetical protein ACJ78Q_15575 [Chloroflexia bacterium]
MPLNVPLLRVGLKTVDYPGVRVRDFRPALRRLRAIPRLGAVGSVAVPPELMPMGARVLAQGYLNRVAMPLLNGWLLPRWMREQSDPSSRVFVPRSVHNVMVNQTARNWTALGLPGAEHPVESMVDGWGLLTPVPGGPSLDWWVEVEGSRQSAVDSRQEVGGRGREGEACLAPTGSMVRQRLQDGLPVVVTSFEEGGLSASSEAWMLSMPSGDWATMRVALVNGSDTAMRGTFRFALRPYNPEGISPVYHMAFDGGSLWADRHWLVVPWPQPDNWRLSGLRGGDLFGRGLGERDQSIVNGGNVFSQKRAREGRLRRSLRDPHGLAHGVLEYGFDLEPGEETAFLAFMPVGPVAMSPRFARGSVVGGRMQTVNGSHWSPTPGSAPGPEEYEGLKAQAMGEWRRLVDAGMGVSLPDRELQKSWEANRYHLLALHDGGTITPGPDLYHAFWFRDAAYMMYALSTHGYGEAARQLLEGFVGRQQRNGSFVSQSSEWDSTGQVLWAIERHLAMHPDAELEARWRPAVEMGARWIRRTLRRSGGLMPPGLSSEHFGPPDRYYWDDLWSLAGLRAGARLTGEGHSRGRGRGKYGRAASDLRARLARMWVDDGERCGGALPGAEGRGIDLSAVGVLAAWYPLGLLGPENPYLAGTLCALERELFYEGALFVNTGHSGWGTYVNMRIAGCLLLLGSERGWELMRWLLEHASGTYNWPEAIDPRSGGGSAGDGHHGWASAEWLLLVRSLLLREQGERLYIAPALPGEWFGPAGEVRVERAPTSFGTLGYRVEWDAGAASMRLGLEAEWRRPPVEMWWTLPGAPARVVVDGVEVAGVRAGDSPGVMDASPLRDTVRIPAGARRVEVTLAGEPVGG